VEEIKKETGNDQVEFMEVDLASLESIKSFASAFIARNLPLHILMNNAGLMGPFSLSKDGIELVFATNHLGHFYLTLLLFDVLDKSQPCRIVNVSSEGHKAFAPREGIRFDHINDKATYSVTGAYGQSKLANVLFTRELTRRLGERKIYVNSNNPGAIRTQFHRNFDIPAWFLKPLAAVAHQLFFVSIENGALTQLYLAASPEVEENNVKGEYYLPTAKKAVCSDMAQDPQMAQKLWDFSVNLIKEKIPDFEVPESLRS